MVATNQKNSRRLELSISNNTLEGGDKCGPKVPGRFAFLVPEVLSFVAFRDSEIFSSYFLGTSRSFPGEPPNRLKKQPQPFSSFLD